METKFIPGILTLTVALFLAAETAEAKCTSKGPGAPNGCGGCNLTNIKKNGTWMEFYRQVKAKGINPISCFRTYACQANLARTCGRKRAARPGRSNHEGSRIAMDFSTRNGDANRAKVVARKVLAGNVYECLHGGVGYHISGGSPECRRFQLSNPRLREYVEQKTRPQARRARAREAASADPADPCANLRCVYLSGKQGRWYKRRSGQWVRMTWR